MVCNWFGLLFLQYVENKFPCLVVEELNPTEYIGTYTEAIDDEALEFLIKEKDFRKV